MKKADLLVLVLVGLLAGCDNAKSPAKELTCKDDPTGRPKAEQIAIGDACFRGGSFKKSVEIGW